MTIVYGRHHADIGPFHDTKYLVAMLDRTCDRVERYGYVYDYGPESLVKTQKLYTALGEKHYLCNLLV